MEKDVFVELSTALPIEKIKPLYLATLLAEVEVIQTIIHFFNKRYSVGDEVKIAQFIQYIKREYGDRDVIRRSVSSFFKSLYYFGLFETVVDQKFSAYRFTTKLQVDEKIFPYMLFKLFAVGQNKLQVDVQEITSSPLMCLFDLDNVEAMIQSYQNKYWTISKRIGSEKLTFIPNSWEQLPGPS